MLDKYDIHMKFTCPNCNKENEGTLEDLQICSDILGDYGYTEIDVFCQHCKKGHRIYSSKLEYSY